MNQTIKDLEKKIELCQKSISDRQVQFLQQKKIDELTFQRMVRQHKELLPNDFNPNNVIENFEKNRFIREHLAYNKEALKIFSKECEAKLNKDQLNVYNNY